VLLSFKNQKFIFLQMHFSFPWISFVVFVRFKIEERNPSSKKKYFLILFDFF
jgi:hypothetical protein